MSSSDVAIKSMDLARSITDILGKGGVVSGLVGDVMKWLAREGINEEDFTYCLNETRALLYPNSKGLEIQSSLRKSDDKLRRNPYVAGLSLLGAGNIGRWMAQSPEYCYLATTVATLLLHHDMRYAASALCGMVLLEDKQVGDCTKVESYAIRKARLLPVIWKTVESIMLNVVNCGHDLGGLPPQLHDICGHTCDARAFATVTMAMSKTSSDLIIRCKKFLVDVFVWVLAHIEGNLELSVAGQIVYRENIADSRRSLLFLVDEDCYCNQQSPSAPREHNRDAITVSTSIESSLQNILEWSGQLESACGKRPFTRAKLYDLDTPTGYSMGGLLPAEKRGILQASQSIVLWVLKQSAHYCSIGRSNKSIVPESSGMLIGDLFSRWPRICNESFDGARVPATVSPSPKTPSFPSEVLFWFLESRTVLEACISRCLCRSCSSHDTSHPTPFGCLNAMANSEILRLIAHSIADGFGTDDTSGFGFDGRTEDTTSWLLADLLDEYIVPWRKWFELAASVYLGCPIISDAATPGIVAAQFGSLVVAAPWIDIRSEVQVRASFGVESAQARLRGVDTDWVVLCTESTAGSSFGDLDLSAAKLPTHDYGEQDDSELSLQSSIHPSGSNSAVLGYNIFMLVTIAKVGKHTRIVDPTSIPGAIVLSHIPRCSHTNSPKSAIVPSPPHRIWSFEEAVGFWEDTNFDDGSSSWSYSTTILDSHAKYNTLMALSPQSCIVKTADCCFACAQKELDRQFTDSKSRRILSIAISEKRLTRRQL